MRRFSLPGLVGHPPADVVEGSALAWHVLSAADVLQHLGCDADRGLSQAEAARRLALYGRNELPRASRASALRLLAAQFTELLVVLLMAAIAVSLALQEWLDAGAIAAILALNAVLGFLQEHRAERALQALERMASPVARVVREGSPQVIEASQLVPGDLLVLSAGDIIAADGRLTWSEFLQVQEAALTGESLPEEKRFDSFLPGTTPLADRLNMVYGTTMVTRGNGRAVVTATGRQTEAGRLASLVRAARPGATPLQRRLGETARWLIGAALSLSGLLLVVGVLRGQEPGDMFITAVALAVAAVPEGLPAAVTVVLALGVQRMVRRHVLVRRLQSVETLGATTVICTDKTGTLTQNRLTVTELFAGGETILPGRARARPSAAARVGNGGGALGQALLVAALCHEGGDETEGDGPAVRDPIEEALLSLARGAGYSLPSLQRSHRLAGRMPFDPDRKMMTAVYALPDGTAVAFSKGAPEAIAARSDRVLWRGEEVAMGEDLRRLIGLRTAEMAARGLRVIALAYRALPRPAAGLDLERQLVFVALVGLTDPLRPEARAAIDSCRRAGIRVLILTGDHAETAGAVARELALVPEDEAARVLSGGDIEGMSEDELARAVETAAVYARVTGEHKLRIVRALRRRGEVVAVSGDGVNDAPALKEADIGVAMGRSGTDVAREASDMILTDDNFSSIVAAVEEGRTIYANIRRFVYFLLSCNLGEILVMLAVASALGGTALLPVQILWVNLVTDGLPALALGLEPAKPQQMAEKPRPPGSRLLDIGTAPMLIVQAALLAAPTLAAFGFGMARDDVEEARELAFMTLVVAHLFAALNYRSVSLPFLRLSPFSNPQLLIAIAAAFALQLAPFYLPPLNDVFEVSPFAVWEWALIVPLASISFWGMETFKVIRLRGQPGTS